MSFDVIPKVEPSAWYFDTAVRKANKSTDAYRSKLKRTISRLDKSKNMELYRVRLVAQHARAALQNITVSFPQTAHLTPFYQALVKTALDFSRLKRSLGAVHWAEQQIHKLSSSTVRTIKYVTDGQHINKERNAFYGRLSSVLKQIKDALVYLEECRHIFKRFPTVKDMPTVVIAGYPNVGKTTLLSALTGSEPEIAPYPFTTKQLMIGYYKKEVQVIDTPGLLDRPLHKRNAIELQAVLALAHLAHVIVFVMDPTETCEYTSEEQLRLYNDIQKTFGLPTLLVTNKADMADTVGEHRTVPRAVPHSIAVSAKEKKGLQTLLHAIQRHLPSNTDETHANH